MNDEVKIEYLPSEHKENLNDPEEKVRAEYYFCLKNITISLSELNLKRKCLTERPNVTRILLFTMTPTRKNLISLLGVKKTAFPTRNLNRPSKQAIANARVLHAPLAICVAGTPLS